MPMRIGIRRGSEILILEPDGAWPNLELGAPAGLA
jgi:hypothetical protein